MARYHSSEGICLRRLDYSNTSQVATFLTPDRGQLSFLAKGRLRAPKRGISTGFELLSRYELIYVLRRFSSLHNLTDSSLQEPFRGVRGGVERILCAYYAAELMLNFTAESEPCAEIYALLVETLRRLETGEGLGLSVLLLELGALAHHGACPTFDACAECGRSLPPTGRRLFSAPHGGPLCPLCGRDAYAKRHAHALPVSGRHLGMLASLARGDDLSSQRPEPAEIVSAGRVVRFHMRYMLDKELRMWKYLQGRHLSRALKRVRRRAGLKTG